MTLVRLVMCKTDISFDLFVNNSFGYFFLDKTYYTDFMNVLL